VIARPLLQVESGGQVRRGDAHLRNRRQEVDVAVGVDEQHIVIQDDHGVRGVTDADSIRDRIPAPVQVVHVGVIQEEDAARVLEGEQHALKLAQAAILMPVPTPIAWTYSNCPPTAFLKVS